ncbi:MAG: TMEM43 family protein [bacterium]
MSYTEVTRQGFLGRLGSSIKGILVGLLFVPGSCILLFWNEGRAIKTQRSLEEGAGAVVHVDAGAVSAGNEGKLVHLTGTATTDETVADPDLAVSAKALRMKRDGRMYQWVEEKHSETHKKIGGGSETRTTYTYEKKWEDHRVRSEEFKEGGHQNPASMPYAPQAWDAAKVTVGAFQLSTTLVSKIDAWQKLPLSEVPERLLEKATIDNGEVFVGANPSSPAVGDAKIGWSIVAPAAVSLVARQAGGGLAPYQTKAGRDIELLTMGNVDAQAMFQSAMRSNAALTWVLRFVGWLVMTIGIALMFRPFVVMSDVIPIVGSMLGFGVGLFAMAASFFISGGVVAVSWFFFRPLLSIALFAAGFGAVALVFILGRGRRKAAAA